VTPPIHRLLFGVVKLAVVLGALELLSWAAIALLAGDSRFDFTPVGERLAEQSRKLEEILADENRLIGLDAELGWVSAPNRSSDLSSTNSRGLRGRREYTAQPAAGVLRVAAFGDSFVFGNEVGDEDAWTRQAERMQPRVEVLNYGVGDYGSDQALLLYRRRGQELAPQVVVLGFPEVDLPRNVNRYRRFLGAHDLPLFKPRFELDPHGELRVIPNPFPGEAAVRRVLEDPRLALEAGAHDELFEPLVWRNPLYDRSHLVRLASTVASRVWQSHLRPDRFHQGDEISRDSQAFAVLVAIVRAFAREVENAGGSFVLLIFPARDEDIWGSARRGYAPLIDALPGITVLDLADALSADPELTPATLRVPGGHYSPAANAATARALLELLRARGLL
jgi:hypothetical protein